VRLFARFSLLCFLALAAAATLAQGFPQRPVRLVVPYPPGSGTDIVARILGQMLTESWGQQVIVDNRPGAGAIIGVEAVAKAAPDGYTIGIADTGPLAINPALYPKLPYNPVRDLAPVTLVANLPFILVVNPNLPVHNVAELVALAKSKPGQINYASVGNGSAVHLATELFKTRAGINLTHIPYKGSAPALQGLLGGEASVMFVNLLSAKSLVQSGKVRALAAAPGKRIAAMPDLPTIAEAGVPGYAAPTWSGVIAPAGVPRPIIDKLNAAINGAIQSQTFRNRFAVIGDEPAGGTPEEFAEVIRADSAKWGEVVRRSGARLD
jgi:tripartite-type tricarboxylate transporter receptor subunit TctC